MNLAIFSPNQNPYSETFIQAHKKGLSGRVFYYYGRGLQIHLEDSKSLMPTSLFKLLLVFTKVFRKGTKYLWTQNVLYSLKRNKIDSILVEYGTHAYHLLPVLQASKIPFVVHFHGYDASVIYVIQSCDSYKKVFELSRNVVAVSTVMYQKLLELGCPKEKLIYNVYGPQIKFENVTPKFNKKQFVAVGRFTDKKAPYYTILAFKGVLGAHPDAKLVIGGNGELFNACANLIRHFKLEKNIRLLGVIKPEEYISLLEESLGFVQHSITTFRGDMEGTPLAVLEASVAGLPVISTFHAGVPDVIIHEKTGLLSEEHDVDTMRLNMLALLNDVNLAKRLGAAGKINILENFNLKMHLSKLDEILKIH